MKTIEYKCKAEVKHGAFWITNKDYEEQYRNITPYNWQRDVHQEFSDEEGWVIQRGSSENIPFALVVIEEITKLLQQGFVLSDKAQKQYEYWGCKYAEILSQQKEELEKREQLKREQEERVKQFTYVQWCNKFGCRIKNGCGSCARRFQGCRPESLRVKLVGTTC